MTCKPPKVLPDLDALTADIREQLRVGLVELVNGGVVFAHMEAWVQDRANNIAQAIVGNYLGDCQEHGAVPFREQNETTTPIEVATRKGT